MRLATLAIALTFGLLAASGASAKSTQCKDDHGKFIKCPAAAVAATPAPAPVAAKATRCKDPKGKFIKCGAPAMAAAPAAAAKPATLPVVTHTVTTHTATTHTAAAPATPTMSAAGAPAGASAKCKDGTYSMSKTHSGTCSHHGGVAAWLQ